MAVFTDNNLYPGRIDTAMPGFVGNSILSYSYTSASVQNDAKYYFVYKNTNYYFLVSAAAGDHTIMFDVPSKKIFLDSKDNEIQLVNPQSTTGYTLITLSNSSTVRVYLDITEHNSINDIKAGAYLQVSLRYQTSNENALSDSSGIAFKTLTQESGTKYYFNLNASDLADGVFYTYEYYKLQFRFTDSGATDYSSGPIDIWLATKNQGGKTNLDNSSEWSTVCLIRQISDFDLQVEGWAAGGTSGSPTQVSLPSLYDISGFIKFDEMPPGDSEYLKSIQITWANKDSGVIYTDSYGNSYNKFKYDFRYNFIAGNTYNIKITATTNTLYIKDFYYTVTIDTESQTLNFNPEISYDTSEEEGLIKMHLDYESNYDANTLNIYRTCAKDNYTNKEKIYSGELKNEENPEYISGTGESISLNGTAEGKMIIGLYGNTSQVQYSGKNKFDLSPSNLNASWDSGDTNKITIVDSKTVKSNAAYGNWRAKCIDIPLAQANTQYTLTLTLKSSTSEKVSKGVIQLVSYDGSARSFIQIDGENYYNITSLGSYSITFTTPADMVNLGLSLNVGGKDDTKEAVYSDIMLRLASITDDTYEPYCGGTPSPNPDYPQDIHSVSGDNEIEVCGKNLANITYGVVPSTSNGQNVSLQYGCSSDYIKVDTSMTYIGSYSGTAALYLLAYDSNNNYLGYVNGSYFTTLKNNYPTLKKVRVRVDGSSSNPTPQVQFEQNSTATTYEPYTGNIYPLYLPVENLFNKDATDYESGYYFKNDGTKAVSANWGIWYIQVIPNTSYVVSGATRNDGAYFWWLDENKTPISLISSHRDVSATSPNNVKYIGLSIVWNTSSSAYDSDTFMLEKGTKANHYTPYGTTPIELNKIGNYQDYFYKNIPSASDYSSDRELNAWYLKKNIGKILLDGVNNQISSVSNNGSVYYGILGYVNDTFKSPANDFLPISNYYIGGAPNVVKGRVYIATSKNMVMCDTGTSLTTKALWNTWLETHNVIVYYVMYTPTYTKITDTTLLNQLDTIWYSQDGQTNISQINNDKAFIINANILDSSAIQMSTDYNDYSIESGILYKYSFQIENNKNNNKSAEKTTSPNNPIGIVFDHAYLKHGNQQLKIKYNPQISSMKTTYSENKTETIGSQFPFIRRNAAVKYRTFPISGLISYFMDEEGHLFSSREYEYGNNLNDYNTFNNNNGITYLTDYTYERLFRDRVRDFLEDGEVKLFKSPTEGNILVRLMDVNFSPNQTNGRMIWTFSATAYEMAEATIKNMGEYNIIPADIENNFGIDNYNNQIVTTTRMPHVDGEVYDDEDSVPWSV